MPPGPLEILEDLLPQLRSPERISSVSPTLLRAIRDTATALNDPARWQSWRSQTPPSDLIRLIRASRDALSALRAQGTSFEMPIGRCHRHLKAAIWLNADADLEDVATWCDEGVAETYADVRGVFCRWLGVSPADTAEDPALDVMAERLRSLRLEFLGRFSNGDKSADGGDSCRRPNEPSELALKDAEGRLLDTIEDLAKVLGIASPRPSEGPATRATQKRPRAPSPQIRLSPPSSPGKRAVLFKSLAESLKAAPVDDIPAADKETIMHNLAVQLEEGVFSAYGPNRMEDYLDQLQSIRFNLLRNRPLLDRLVAGDVSPADLATATPEDLATEEVRKKREAIISESNAARQPQKLEANCSTEPCPKCRSNKVFVIQRQTRSADEPMTQFFTCTECTKKWKK